MIHSGAASIHPHTQRQPSLLTHQLGRLLHVCWRVDVHALAESTASPGAGIVGHPQEAPSVQELDYMNPALGEDAIRRHLGVL